MSKLDRAVDAALREMVAGDGPPDLLRRVLARIDEPVRRPAPPWLVLAAAAGIAVAVAVGALLRTTPGHEGVTPSVRPPARALPVAPPAGTPVAALPAVPATPPHSRPPRGQRPEAEGPALEVEARLEVEPIELAPLAVAPITGEHINVTALTLERMEIEPLAETQR